MKNTIKIIFVLALFTMLNSCGEDGTIGIIDYGNITGRVVQKNTFDPIENARVTLSPSNNTTFTDANGNFSFTNVEAQSYSVQATKEDFQDKFESAEVSANGTINVVIEMEVSTANNQPPRTPELLTPADNTDDLDTTVELVWSASDPDEDPLKYRLEVRNNVNTDVQVIENLTDTTYTLDNLKYGRTYFWQVAAKDDLNPEVLSATSSFKIKDSPENNRFMYVKKENGNNVIYSASLNPDNNQPFNEFRLTDVSTNSWRPRKNNTVDLIAFLRTDNNETHIYTMKPNGDDVTRVTSTVPVSAFNLNEVEFSWNSTGDQIIYPSFGKLYRINKDGSGLQLIHETFSGNLITECDWSNDGTKIAVKTNNSEGYNGAIYTINMSGNILQVIESGSVGALGGINFSVAADKLLYTKDISNFQSNNYRQLDTRIFIYDFGTAISTDFSLNAKPAGTNDLDPRFSPNEAEVIFVNTSNDGVSQRNIEKTNLNLNDINRAQLFQDATMPDWE